MSNAVPRVLALIVLSGSGVAAQNPPRHDSTAADTARPVRLAPLEVSVTRGLESRARVPAAVGVIGQTDLRRAQLTSGLDEALGRIPGVLVANRYNFSLDQRLSLRGAGSRAQFGLRGVKVLLDGVPQTLPDGQSQLTNVDLGLLERAEVLVGAASALYGNAAGGIIALTTEDPASRFRQRLRFSAGAFGTTKWNLVGSGRQGRLGGTLALTRFESDGFRQHGATLTRQLYAAAGYTLSGSTTADLRYYLADSPRAENPGALTAAEMALRPDSAAANNILRGADKAVTQHQLSFRIKSRDGHGNELEAVAFGLTRDLTNPLATAPPGPAGPTVGTYSAIDRVAGGVRLRGGRALGTSPRSPRLTLGLDLQSMRDDRVNRRSRGGQPSDTVVADQRERVTELGPYATLHWEPVSSLLLLAGIRADRVSFRVRDRFLGDGVDNSGSRVMSAASGSFGLSWERSPRLIPYANAASAFETPTSTELVNQSNGTIGFNTALGPQRARSVEAGVRGEIGDGRAGRTFGYSLALYTSSVRDALVQARELDGRAFFENAGRLRHRGLEAGVTAAPVSWAQLRLAYTFSDSRFREYRIRNGATVDTLDGKRVAGIPRHVLRAGGGLFLGPAFVELEQQVTSALFADDRNAIPVEGWRAGVTTVRLSADLAIGATRLRPFVGVNNLFDRRYVAAVTVNGFGGRVFEPAPGRNAYVGMEVAHDRP